MAGGRGLGTRLLDDGRKRPGYEATGNGRVLGMALNIKTQTCFSSCNMHLYLSRRHYDTNMLPAADKMIFLDIIIDDDSGEKEERKDIVPYQLSKEAVIMDMKVQDITVRSNTN